MAQHFLLSSRARDLDIGEIHRLSDADARNRFRELCWPDTNGEPVCPSCGGMDHWTLVAGAKWKCKDCKLQFTPTSDTCFKGRKLSYRQLLVCAAIFANGVNGVAACRMAREMKVAYKSAFVLLHKIREIMGKDEDAARLGGVVEIDGAIFGGSMPRLPNTKALWAEFFKKNKAAARRKRRLIVVLRERRGLDPDVPPKVRTFLLGKEGDAVEIARRIVMPDTILHADFSTQWEPLNLYFDTKRINHSESYSKDGACTNQAESFFSRMRTAQRGVYKIISGAHLSRYAMELGWREQYSRKSNGTQHAIIIGAVGRSKPSRTFLGYWRKRPANDNGDFFAQFAA